MQISRLQMTQSKPYTILLSTLHYFHPEGIPVDWIVIGRPGEAFFIRLGVRHNFEAEERILYYGNEVFHHIGIRADKIGRVIRMERDELAQLVHHLYHSKSVVVESVSRKGWWDIMWLRLWGKILMAFDR